ncbi:hypothetical protein F4780DRAFT_714371 [Xylariomycetidae sp. FL0641]|nr:hypothetical protein F4780DRAFT_714371 [Xylariomycetidae sp. FL0641]
MAAMTTASGTTTISPPASSGDDHGTWKYAGSGHHANSLHFNDYDANTGSTSEDVFSSHSGNANRDSHDVNGYAPTRDSHTDSRANSLADNKRSNTEVEGTDENSKWIHRDKLAKIESEELQAAGIKLPKSRAQSRPRRDRSEDKMSGRRPGTDASDSRPQTRSRKNSDLSWDLRMPGEGANDSGQSITSNGPVKGSRIPVPKSPAPLSAKSGFPLATDDEPLSSPPKSRSRSGSMNALDAVTRPPTTKRAVTESPTKKTTTAPATRKASAPAKSGASTRPKTRPGGTQRNGSSARPSTRSGDLSPSPRAPEGDPPWMISAYKPDPRLPPDQQLLPTVAKRLQQEKWEQEGKFGNVYDKDFRPLNEEAFVRPPELDKPRSPEPESDEYQQDWPLRPEAKNLAQNKAERPELNRPGTGSYSTMPKIQDPPVVSPVNSPRSIQQPQMGQLPQRQPRPESQPQPAPVVRLPEPPEQEDEKPKKGGCGCCVVM